MPKVKNKAAVIAGRISSEMTGLIDYVDRLETENEQFKFDHRILFSENERLRIQVEELEEIIKSSNISKDNISEGVVIL